MTTPDLQGRRILLVEDEYMIAQDVRRELEGAGAVVVGPSPSVARALKLLESEAAIDGAVLDVNLGEEKSFPIAQALKEREIPFLFATGYNSGDIPAEWRRETVVMKPLQMVAVAALFAEPDGADAHSESEPIHALSAAGAVQSSNDHGSKSTRVRTH